MRIKDMSYMENTQEGMRAMKHPSHFPTSLTFQIYTIGCAIQDRQVFLECYDINDGLESTKRIVDETREELLSMNRKKKSLEKRRKKRDG